MAGTFLLSVGGLAGLLLSAQCVTAELQFGMAMGDCTGPPEGVTFMGYAQAKQVGAGIHTRQHARAMVAVDTDTNKRFAFVSVDAGMGSTVVKRRVVEELAKKGLGIYTDENVAISGTHSHSTPGGFLASTLYQVSVLGYSHESTDNYVSGVVEAISKAHENIKPQKVRVNIGKMAKDVASKNRSPTAYPMNPAEERALYPDGDTDLNMTQLNFFDGASGEPTGIFNWFATHGTSLNNTNTLISGDNKGWASQVVERKFNKDLPGKGPFVAAFAATNLGDVSPNTDGAKCQDTGLPCQRNTSTCNGKITQCYALGPGTNGDMWESVEIVANHQADLAMKLMEASASEAVLAGPVDYRHTYVDFSKLVYESPQGPKKLCPPAMGFSFAAGTTDGTGLFYFEQGVNSSKSANPFWRFVGGLVSKPTEEQKACHAPKQILLNTGFMDTPYPWDPVNMPIQILRIGKFFILSVPTEFTTMAGRRLRNAVAQTLVKEKVLSHPGEGVFVIAGLSNGYSSYTTTYEEYQAQRYEGGSTIFGPHEADGFNQEMSRIARDMARGEASHTGPAPPSYDSHISFIPPVIADAAGWRHHFGDALTIPKETYRRGRDTVTVTFQCASPRNNVRLGGSYFYVERQEEQGWLPVASDDNVETKMHFYRHEKIAMRSFCDIVWKIPADTQTAVYRISIFGTHKSVLGKMTDFTGQSGSFRVA